LDLLALGFRVWPPLTLSSVESKRAKQLGGFLAREVGAVAFQFTTSTPRTASGRCAGAVFRSTTPKSQQKKFFGNQSLAQMKRTMMAKAASR
jgi:hypothetical protein